MMGRGLALQGRVVGEWAQDPILLIHTWRHMRLLCPRDYESALASVASRAALARSRRARCGMQRNHGAEL
jgi:hypothetical protein